MPSIYRTILPSLMTDRGTVLGDVYDLSEGLDGGIVSNKGRGLDYGHSEQCCVWTRSRLAYTHV